jgi:tRNA-splicing ligase RtcB (3'-phosphate/5'-hydroxy nucleic acid ligase)
MPPPSSLRPPVDVRAWIDGVDVEPLAKTQLLNMASLSIIRHPIAAMPDLHVGVGATVGAVVPTYRAIIPSAVGVDIGCGMIAVKTTLTEEDLPNNLVALRIAIEEAVPHGRTHNGNPNYDAGSWCNEIPRSVVKVWTEQLEAGFKALCVKRPMLAASNHINHLGTLGTGNHFIEICLEEGHDDDGDATHSKRTVHTSSSDRAMQDGRVASNHKEGSVSSSSSSDQQSPHVGGSCNNTSHAATIVAPCGSCCTLEVGG